VARYERPSGSSGIANQMALDKVGNCYILGNSNIGSGVIVLIKYNASGDTLWTRAIAQANNKDVIADSIGNVYITANLGPAFGPHDILIVKYNPLGIEQWQRIYDTGNNDEATKLAMDRTGNVYLGGFTGNQSLIIKYNPAGDTLWTRKHNEANYRFPVNNLILDNSNNVYICGERINTTNSGILSMFTIKYDSTANFKWTNNPLVTQMQFSVNLGVDNIGNVYVSGGSFTGKIITIKYDSIGLQQWQKIYDGPGNGMT
jgi:hypothetical protein